MKLRCDSIDFMCTHYVHVKNTEHFPLKEERSTLYINSCVREKFLRFQSFGWTVYAIMSQFVFQLFSSIPWQQTIWQQLYNQMNITTNHGDINVFILLLDLFLYEYYSIFISFIILWLSLVYLSIYSCKIIQVTIACFIVQSGL
jgi:hypothetical protein